jgi:NAD(P)H-hydrate epimerase
MRQVERRAVEAGVSLDALMENAGLAVADAVTAMLGNPWWKKAAVLCGPGNNGGDGLVAARHLAVRGVRVECFLPLPRKSPDPKRDLAVAAGVKVADLAECGGSAGLLESLKTSDLIIDAVFGTGQDRPITEPVAGVLGAARHSGRPVVALDLPTGTNSDTGAFDVNGLPASRTLMLGLPKIGPLLMPVEARLGDLQVLDIGLPPGTDAGIKAEWITPRVAKQLLPARPGDAHKGTFGRALIVAGSRSYVGAALLAAQGAVRSGAGLVELATPEPVWRVAAGQLLEAVHVPLPERVGAGIDPVAAGQEVLNAARKATALLVGPGLGQGRATAEFVSTILASKPETLPAVLDADALNALAAGHRWWERSPGPAVMTPHPGEMARLLGRSVADVQKDRLSTVTEAAVRFGKIVILKGAATVIASPDGAVRVSPWVNSGLAKGGTGDVLAGLVVGLLAQMPARPFDAAALGVYLHGLAGEMARSEAGEHGMTAGDVAARLPRSFVRLAQDEASPVVRTV